MIDKSQRRHAAVMVLLAVLATALLAVGFAHVAVAPTTTAALHTTPTAAALV